MFTQHFIPIILYTYNNIFTLSYDSKSHKACLASITKHLKQLNRRNMKNKAINVMHKVHKNGAKPFL